MMMSETLHNVRVAFFGSDLEIFRSLDRDHEYLKDKIEQLRSTESFAEKKKILNQFTDFLIQNTLCEDEIYLKMIQIANDRDCCFQICDDLKESINEHRMQREMIRRIHQTESQMRWEMRVKIFFETVLEHLQEEQEIYLLCKPLFDMDEREILGDKYFELKENLQASERRASIDRTSTARTSTQGMKGEIHPLPIWSYLTKTYESRQKSQLPN